MEKNLVLLLLLSPFVGFLFNVFFGKKAGKSVSGALGTLAIVLPFVLSVYFFMQVNQTGNQFRFRYLIGFKSAILNWISEFY